MKEEEICKDYDALKFDDLFSIYTPYDCSSFPMYFEQYLDYRVLIKVLNDPKQIKKKKLLKK